MTQSQTQPVVLVVEDEPDIADSYQLWLKDTYDIRPVETGEAALSKLETLEVDVVLLDRMLPGMSGDDVLREIRAQGHECRVTMVSAVEPGIDVVEMGFDSYITKPPDKAELRETIEQLLNRSTLDEELQEYYSLVARRSALESEVSDEDLAKKEDYRSLVERIKTHRAAVSESIPDLESDTEFVGAVREIAGQSTNANDQATQSQDDEEK